MDMGRAKIHNKHLPPRMVLRHGAYYHTPRIGGHQQMVRLSANFTEAINLYYQREKRTLAGSTVNDALSRYDREVLPGKAPKTQRDYRRYIPRLREVFGDCRLASVRRSDVAQYLDRRSAKIEGNREIACLSSSFQSAIRWGWCDDNPCRGAPRNPERRRLRVPSDAELAAIRMAASEQLHCMVDLVLLVGLRKSDLLNPAHRPHRARPPRRGPKDRRHSHLRVDRRAPRDGGPCTAVAPSRREPLPVRQPPRTAVHHERVRLHLEELATACRSHGAHFPRSAPLGHQRSAAQGGARLRPSHWRAQESAGDGGVSGAGGDRREAAAMICPLFVRYFVHNGQPRPPKACKFLIFGGPWRTRTSNLLMKSLYPVVFEAV